MCLIWLIKFSFLVESWVGFGMVDQWRGFRKPFTERSLAKPLSWIRLHTCVLLRMPHTCTALTASLCSSGLACFHSLLFTCSRDPSGRFWSKTHSGSRVNGGRAVQFSYQGLMNFRSKEASRLGLVICWLKCTSTGHHSARHSVFLNEERTSVWVCFAVRMSCVIRPVAVGSRLWPWCIYSFSCFQTVFVCHVRSFAWISKSLAEKWQWDFLW